MNPALARGCSRCMRDATHFYVRNSESGRSTVRMMICEPCTLADEALAHHSEYYPLDERTACEFGQRGGDHGAPGNENVVDGVVLCEYCSVIYQGILSDNRTVH